MAYTALYRKKRPQTFGEVIGQPHVVRTLLNQLAAGHITHAYLFSGTRGTGKTTTARLFARAVNCLAPIEGEPCNTCEVCRNIITERNLNVIEIDAASNNGVDNIRDLREEVKYPPTEGKYKVYIVDEAHMLTTSAFNALLKTLEEPPAHVIFILATTDPQKLPATILSRCQRYDFKRLTVTDMVNTLMRYITEENAEADEEAVRYIASVSDGAMRDALSTLDQCLTFYEGERVTPERVLALLGAVDRQVLFDFTDALAHYDSAGVLAVIDTISRDGRDIAQFANDCVRHFRDLLVAAHVSQQSDILDHTAETVTRLKAQSTAVSAETLITYIRLFSELLNELRHTAHARMALEVCAIRLCYPEYASGEEDDRNANHRMETIMARLEKLERLMEEQPSSPRMTTTTYAAPIESTSTPASASTPTSAPELTPASAPVSAPASVSTPTPISTPASVSTTPTPISTPVSISTPISTPTSISTSTPAPTPLIINRIQKEWSAFCRQTPMPLRSMLNRCAAVPAGGLLQINCADEAILLFVKERQKQIQERLTAFFSLTDTPNLAFAVGDSYNKSQNESQHESRNESQIEHQSEPPHQNAVEQDEWAAFGEQVNMDAGW